MNKIIFRLAITAIIIVTLINSGAINALFMLFVAGTVPGTSYVVPANSMMLGYCTIICVILFYSTAKEILRSIFTYHLHAYESSDTNNPAERRVKLI